MDLIDCLQKAQQYKKHILIGVAIILLTTGCYAGCTRFEWNDEVPDTPEISALAEAHPFDTLMLPPGTEIKVVLNHDSSITCTWHSPH